MPAVVDVWLYRLHAGADYESLARALSPVERERIEAFVHPEERIRRTVARARMRAILAGYTGGSAQALVLAEGAQGKPHIAGSALGFNLSHCGERALLAVAHGANVGVDLEREREDVEVAQIVQRYFSADEREIFAAQRIAERQRWFFRQWTAKEAVVKAHGGGLSVAPESFSVRFDDAQRAHVLSPRTDPGAHWRVQMLDAGSGWHAAVAHDGPPRRLRILERDFTRS